MKRMIILLLLSAAACAPKTEYIRPDTAVTQRDADEKDCYRIANDQALEESYASHPIFPPYRETQFVEGGDENGGGRYASYGRRGARVYELAEYCMEQRGYKLVQVRP
ncbi:MAG TPA: hypothetical protein VF194_13155 [Ferrovibrio sp.]|jgi:hypothetical protein|uniref:hypothetical protein n=1 Tax=Ferrovibrio sp. TaxID=1917215 RepID=UPI002ED5FFEF